MRVKREKLKTIVSTVVATLIVQAVAIGIWRHVDAEWFKQRQRNEVFAEMGKEAMDHNDMEAASFWYHQIPETEESISSYPQDVQKAIRLLWKQQGKIN